MHKNSISIADKGQAHKIFAPFTRQNLSTI